MANRPDPFQELEQLVDDFLQTETSLAGDLPVDVVDADDEIHVKVDLPGYDSDDIDVTLEESRQLTVTASRRMEHEEIDGQYVTQERSHEQTSRSVRLPAPVDEDATEASYDRGVLTVRLPKLTGDDEGTEIPVS